MSLDKVAIRNERPGTLGSPGSPAAPARMTVPGLRPPDEADFVAPSEDTQHASDKK